jgi:hypothetical protein
LRKIVVGLFVCFMQIVYLCSVFHLEARPKMGKKAENFEF